MLEKKSINRIICVFLPPLIEKLKFPLDKKIKIFRSYLDININDFLSEVLENKECERAVFINYPRQEKQLNDLQEKLEEMKQKITDIILFNFSSYELMTEVQNEYLACPKCQKFFKKAEVVQEEKFLCPDDREEFTLKRASSFSETYLKDYLAKSKKIVEKILAINESEEENPPVINQILIREKEEMNLEELRKQIWELISEV
jgi:adenylate kinase family enzyme